ncbi:MAG TPA: amidohydrolase/deacetylase family metallohydrolase [Acetobacteraceae bacterium]|nr:amidohydrolase/deacetylase family metallohydrolase [Acetobacteraceae bacterium]
MDDPAKAEGETMQYDLLLTGGEVLDPGANLRGVMDVGIAGGKIAAVAPSLPANEARKSISVKGRLVTPGLVDMHAHVFVNAHDMGGHTDRFCRCSGVTTLCDAGSAGSSNFAGLRHILDTAVRTRVRALVNLSAIGITGTSRGGELSHLPYADPEGCARTIIENPDLAFGVKLRFGPGLVWEYSTEPVKLARRAAEMAGGVPMMMHIIDSPVPLPALVEQMKPGDIVTHCYHGRAHGIMGQDKEFVLKEIVEAQRAGIIFDCAHGRNHFNFRMTQRALDQGFMTDTISTDLTSTTATQGPVWDLPTTMTKLLHFGMPLAEVVRRATAVPAKIMGYEGTVGTLKPGANADVSVFELRDDDVELRDSDGDTVTARRRLLPQLTLKDGRVWYERPAG